MSNYVYEEKLLLNACHILPSGRILCRHPNNEGSVLVFDQYGTQTKLYIPDAKFRNFSNKKIASSDTNTQSHTPILKHNSNIYLLDSEKSTSQPFTETEFLTDEQLQTKLDSMLINGSFKDDFTAKQGTDAILSFLDTSSEAATYARSLIPTGLTGCDIPNIYELSVIWLESDNIDSIDPTLNEYSSNRLGSPYRFRSSQLWSCTEIQKNSRFFTMFLDFFGGTDVYIRYNHNYVLPVLEL